MQGEGDARIGHGQALDHLARGQLLGAVRLQELEAGGRGEEQIAHLHPCANGARPRRQRRRQPALDGQRKSAFLTALSARPPPRSSTAIRVAPASIAFSTSSLTAEAGRSITSPAAIRLTTPGGRGRMDGTGAPQGGSNSHRQACLPAGLQARRSRREAYTASRAVTLFALAWPELP